MIVSVIFSSLMQAAEAWNLMLAVVEKLRKKMKPDKSASAVPAFQLLFLHVGLQMFSETQQAVEILDVSYIVYLRTPLSSYYYLYWI